MIKHSLFWGLITEQQPRSSTGHTLIYCSVLAAVAAIIFLLTFVARKTRRQRKRKFKSRNPTLAETGGLPPIRGSEAPDDSR